MNGMNFIEGSPTKKERDFEEIVNIVAEDLTYYMVSWERHYLTRSGTAMS